MYVSRQQVAVHSFDSSNHRATCHSYNSSIQRAKSKGIDDDGANGYLSLWWPWWAVLQCSKLTLSRIVLLRCLTPWFAPH